MINIRYDINRKFYDAHMNQIHQYINGTYFREVILWVEDKIWIQVWNKSWSHIFSPIRYEISKHDILD